MHPAGDFAIVTPCVVSNSFIYRYIFVSRSVMRLIYLSSGVRRKSGINLASGLVDFLLFWWKCFFYPWMI